jgi:hypothetical protein
MQPGIAGRAAKGRRLALAGVAAPAPSSGWAVEARPAHPAGTTERQRQAARRGHAALMPLSTSTTRPRMPKSCPSTGKEQADHGQQYLLAPVLGERQGQQPLLVRHLEPAGHVLGRSTRGNPDRQLPATTSSWREDLDKRVIVGIEVSDMVLTLSPGTERRSGLYPPTSSAARSLTSAGCHRCPTAAPSQPLEAPRPGRRRCGRSPRLPRRLPAPCDSSRRSPPCADGRCPHAASCPSATFHVARPLGSKANSVTVAPSLASWVATLCLHSNWQ